MYLKRFFIAVVLSLECLSLPFKNEEDYPGFLFDKKNTRKHGKRRIGLRNAVGISVLGTDDSDLYKYEDENYGSDEAISERQGVGNLLEKIYHHIFRLSTRMTEIENKFTSFNHRLTQVERKSMPPKESMLPEQCRTYKNLSESTRMYTNTDAYAYDTIHCDSRKFGSGYRLSPDWKGPGWYRFTAGPKGRVALESEVRNEGRCGTGWSGYLDGDVNSLPKIPGQTIQGTVKFRGAPDGWADRWASKISITMCFSYLVFKLPETAHCNDAYCAA